MANEDFVWDSCRLNERRIFIACPPTPKSNAARTRTPGPPAYVRRNFAARLTQELHRIRERHFSFAYIFACPLRVLRPPAALAVHHGRDLLNQFVRLKVRGQLFR